MKFVKKKKKRKRNICGVQATPRTMRHSTRKWLLLFYSTNLGVVCYIATVPTAPVFPFLKLWMVDIFYPSPGRSSLIYYSLSLSNFVLPMALNGIYMFWWLILCVNLTGQWGAQTFGQTWLWVYLWECFWMRLMFQSVDSVDQTVLPHVGGPPSINWRPK